MIKRGNEYLCSRCFSAFDKNTVICPVCGHDDHYSMVKDAIKAGTVLSDRFVIGYAFRRDILGFTYSVLDIMSGKKIHMTEYFPQGISGRDSDGITVIPEPGWEKVFSEGRDTFHEEAISYAARSNVPNVTHTIGFFNTGTACCISEVTEGTTLSEYIAMEGGKLTEAKAKALLSTLVSPVDTLRKSGTYHGDICPENIMVNHNSCTLSGFGRTKAILRSAYNINSDFDVPSGMTKQDNDIRLLAITYFCALTGFTFDSRKFDENQLINPNISDRTRMVIKKAVHGGVYASAGDFFDALDAAIPDIKNIRNDIKNNIIGHEWIKDAGETMTVNQNELNNYVNYKPQPKQSEVSTTELHRTEKEFEGKKRTVSKNAVLAALLSLALLSVIAVFALGGAFKSSKNEKKDTSAASDSTEQKKDEEKESNTPIVIPELKVTNEDAVLEVEEIYQIETVITPDGFGEDIEIKYTSSDEGVAIVDEKGTVLAVAPGNAEITAEFEYEDNKYSDSVKITVNKPEAVLNVDTDYVNVNAEGGTYTIKVESNYEWSYECDVGWLKVTKNNMGLLIVAEANTKEHREGTIRIVSEDKSYRIYVNQERGRLKLEDMVNIEFKEFDYQKLTGYAKIIVEVENISDEYIKDADWSLYLYNGSGIEVFSWNFDDKLNIKPGEKAELEWRGMTSFTYDLAVQIDALYTDDTIIRDGEARLEENLR